MITAVDTSVVLDLLTDSRDLGRAAQAALEQASEQGSIVACEVVWAEVASAFPTRAGFESAMERLGLRFDAIDAATARLAGEIWRSYRSRGGRRTRVAPDFLVGAHAQVNAERLLTRDRGFYRAYFRKLELIDPWRA